MIVIKILFNKCYPSRNEDFWLVRKENAISEMNKSYEDSVQSVFFFECRYFKVIKQQRITTEMKDSYKNSIPKRFSD